MGWHNWQLNLKRTNFYAYPAGCPHSFCADCSTLAVSCCSASAPGVLKQNHLYLFKEKTTSKYIPNVKVILKKWHNKIYDLGKPTCGNIGYIVVTLWGHEGTSWNTRNVLYLGLNSGYMGAYICKSVKVICAHYVCHVNDSIFEGLQLQQVALPAIQK